MAMTVYNQAMRGLERALQVITTAPQWGAAFLFAILTRI